MSSVNKVLGIFIVIFSLTILSEGQVAKEEKVISDPFSQAAEVLSKARKAIYKKPEFDDFRNVKSIFLSVSGNAVLKSTAHQEGREPIVIKNRESTKIDYSVASPSFVRILHQTDRPVQGNGPEMKLKMTTIANKEQIKNNVDATVGGKKIDLGKGFNMLGSIIKIEKPLPKMNKSPKSSDVFRSAFYEKVHNELFPLFLVDLLGKTPIFRYVGKAKSGSKNAFVLEVVPKAADTTDNLEKLESTVRYFFDVENHLLLMVTKDTNLKDVKNNETTYFSDHKLMNGLLIPTKIKKELKVISKVNIEVMGVKIKKSEMESLTNLTVNELDINRKFPTETFKIKK